MPTKRNDKVKEFAIGTKIEYNGKLYEVVEDKYCDNCSIANICSSNDVPSGNKFANVLSRDQRLCIFGDCSNINRADGKDIVFKEIPKTIEQDVYNGSHLYKTNNELMPILIDLPNGYVIDKEHSDFDKGIIAFKNKWLTLEQLYKLVKESHYLTNRSAIKEFRDGKLVALANLMDIASYFNKGWNYDVNQDVVGYMIAYDVSIAEPYYTIRKINAATDVYYGNPVFKNEADAQYVIDNPNFREVLDNIFKV